MNLIPPALRTLSVERVIPAPPEKIFALLADPRRHLEIDGSGTLRGAIDGPAPLGLGDQFGMNMKIGGPYQMTNTVVELEQNRRIAWQPRPRIAAAALLIGGRIFRYELEPVAGGTRVRETWDLSEERFPLSAALRSATRRNMTRTLERLEKAVTA